MKHSAWIAELEAIDRVHPQRWRNVQHYLLCFKDRMFEAIALGVQQLGTFGSTDERFRVPRRM